MQTAAHQAYTYQHMVFTFRSYQSNPHPISKQRGKTKKHEKTIVCPNYLRCISPKPKGGDTSRFHGASNASGSDDKMDEQLPDASSDLVTGRSFTSATNSWDLGMAKFFEVLVVTGSLPVWSGGSLQWPILFAKAWHHLVSLTPTKISDEGLTPRPAHAAIPRQHLQRHLLPTCVVKEGETSTHWTHWSIDHWWLPWATSNSYIYIYIYYIIYYIYIYIIYIIYYIYIYIISVVAIVGYRFLGDHITVQGFAPLSLLGGPRKMIYKWWVNSRWSLMTTLFRAVFLTPETWV